MIVVIAFVAALGLGWLGWQAKIVQDRRAMRAQIETSGGATNANCWISPWPKDAEFRAGDENSSVSGIRRRLGDEPMFLLLFRRRMTTADRAAIAAFPEAEVKAVPEHDSEPLPSLESVIDAVVERGNWATSE